MDDAVVTVDDVVVGGIVGMPPTDIPTIDGFAVMADPRGASINAITCAMPEK